MRVRATAAKSKKRVQLDLSMAETKALDGLRDACYLRSRADAVRTALAVLEWVRMEVEQGRRVVAVGDGQVSWLAVPGLVKPAREEMRS
jgi:hypothetical protein